METLEDCFSHDRALVFGVGGSGDVVGSIPTARLLESHGVDVLLGGVTWEPAPYDSRPGPRGFDEIDGLERVSDTVGLATGDTVTEDGMEFTETRVARHYDEPVALVDLAGGAVGMTRGLDAACSELDLDLVVGVDVGGDVLAVGTEPGLRSPATDGLGLAALEALETDSCLGMFGYGSDGELALAELESGIARAAARGGLLGAWGLTPRVRDELESVLEVVETEASRLPVEAARGDLGRRTIRRGEVTLDLRPPSVVTFYFDPGAVAATSELDDLVRGTETLEAATSALAAAGYVTEFDRERERL